jgi:hypothetical protein
MNGPELRTQLLGSLQDAIPLQRRESARHRSNGLKYRTYQQGAGGATIYRYTTSNFEKLQHNARLRWRGWFV